MRFLAGFAVLYGVLAATSAVDATGRWGLAILAAVLVTAPAGVPQRRPSLLVVTYRHDEQPGDKEV